MPPRGGLLGGRYELLAPLASGGMGRVWRARDTRLQRPVAVKVLRSEFTHDPTFRARFRAEAQHTAVLTHPNIASVYDYGEADLDGEQLAYLVMELVDGEPLSAVLMRERRLDVARTLDVVRQTAAALAAAHAAGVVHRDVKPGNVLLSRDGTVKITDFGIAWSASSVPLTGTGQVLGTAHYLSPEQAAGGKATPASDVYALGALAYECLAGRRPIDGENSVQIAVKQIREEPAPLPPDVPADVRRLVERAMAKDPARRFPDGAALRDAVDALRAGQPTAPVGPVHATTPLGRTTATGGAATKVLPLPPMGGGSAPAGAPTIVAPPLPPAGPPARGPGGPGGPGGRVRRALLAVLAGALTVVVLVAVAVAVTRSQDPSGGVPSPTTGQTTPASTTAQQPQTVTVVAEDYVGRPIAEVQAELAGEGLQAQPVAVETKKADNGVVLALQPVGELPLGSVVTVSYAVPKTGEGGGNGNDGGGNGNDGGGGGNGNNGNGHGRGNDG